MSDDCNVKAVISNHSHDNATPQMQPPSSPQIDPYQRRGPRCLEALPAERQGRRAARLRQGAASLQGQRGARGGAPRPGRLLLPQGGLHPRRSVAPPVHYHLKTVRADAAVAGGDRAAVHGQGRALRAEGVPAEEAGRGAAEEEGAAHAALHVADGDLPGRDQRHERGRRARV